LKTKFLLFFVFAFALVLAACSGDDNTESTKKESKSASDNMLIYARGADSVGLDPINVTDGESIRVTHNIFETLFYYDENLELQPKLAASYEVSEDGLTFTVKLREDVNFQDGTPFNAEAVVYNFNRWMDPENPAHTGGDFTYYSFLFGGFKGDEGHKLEAVTAIDDYTVEFKLKQKIAPFVSYLAIPMLSIGSPTAIEADPEGFSQHPVGTGPFNFEKWEANNTISVVKNEDYYVEGQPKLDGIIFKVVPDNSARMNQLLTGEVDLAEGINTSDASQIEAQDGLSIYNRPSFNMSYMAFNTEKEPLKDVRVRQAISQAIDKDLLVDSFYDGFAETAKNPMPSSLWGYNDSLEDYVYDVEASKKLLADAGYADGLELNLYAMSNSRPYMAQPMKIAEVIQSDLAKIGIKVNIVSYEWATYLEEGSQGKHDLMLMGWTGVMADPDNFLFPNLHSSNATVPASNYAFYQNPQFDALIEQAREEYDQDKRAELYEQAQKIFHEDIPWYMIAHTTPPVAVADYVKGLTLHPMEIDDYAKVSIEK
jgi:peptide/nickel transport system substrate-binding protein